MPDVVIRRYSNGFSVYSKFQTVYSALSPINTSLTQVGMQRQQSKYSKFQLAAPKQDEFFIYSIHENRFYYSNALYQTVMNAIGRCVPPRGIGSFSVEEIDHVQVMGTVVDFPKHELTLVEPDDSPFSFQNEIVDFAMMANTHHRIFEVQTGRGKTKMALKVVVRYGQRLLIVTKAAYVPKWIGDVEENLGIKAGELCVPKSSKQLEDLLEIGKLGRMDAVDKGDKQIKVIIVSSSLLDNWISKWLEHGHHIHPTEITEILGCGMVIYDESHQLFRKNYWSFILTNASKVLDLSATLEPDDTDTFMQDRYNERFPKDDRYAGLEYNKYIDAFSIYYGMSDKKLKKRINGMKMYNHTEFENRILGKQEYLDRYFNMVAEIVRSWYIDKKDVSEKSIVFFATKKLCTMFVEYAKKIFPDLKVTRNIAGDDYNEFISGDLCISTPGSSGTAVDIPGLILSVITVAISKRQMNLQILGRTRDLRKPDKFPRAVFLHCVDCRKHIDYLKKRQRIFDGKVRKFTILNSPFTI